MAEDRKPLISGNWKMHHNHFEAIQTVQKLSYSSAAPHGSIQKLMALSLGHATSVAPISTGTK